MRFPDIHQTRQAIIIAAIIYLIACFAVAWIWGRKRKTGFLWSFFFSALLTPFVGAIITLSSRKLPAERI